MYKAPRGEQTIKHCLDLAQVQGYKAINKDRTDYSEAIYL